jgi:hypothetical protein
LARGLTIQNHLAARQNGPIPEHAGRFIRGNGLRPPTFQSLKDRAVIGVQKGLEFSACVTGKGRIEMAGGSGTAHCQILDLSIRSIPVFC